MSPPPAQAARCARKAGPSSCRQQLALHGRRGVGGAGQCAPTLYKSSVFTRGCGREGKFLPGLPDPTGVLGQCLMRGTGGRTLLAPAAEVFLGGGVGDFGRGQVQSLVTGMEGEVGEGCVGARVS